MITFALFLGALISTIIFIVALTDNGLGDSINDKLAFSNSVLHYSLYVDNILL